MAKKSFAVKHNLDQLSKEELVQYLRDVSDFIGLDPDLNGLDTIWMNNETGPGRSLVVYARRGTAEILRNLYGVEVESLTYATVSGSMVFTAIGRAKSRENRQEIAIGSKYLNGYVGKELDDAIMTASTRALRRLTMQFTTLGILDESEVVALLGQTPNPAGSAQLAGPPMPPIYAAPTVSANNAPGKPAEPPSVPPNAVSEVTQEQKQAIFEQHQQAMRDEASRQLKEKSAPISAPVEPSVAVTPSESTSSKESVSGKEPSTEATPAPRARRARKPRNTVTLDVEPEVVSQSPPAPSAPAIASPAPAPAPAVPATAPAPAVPTVAGQPSPEQMAEYRKKVGAYTAELPSSEGMGSVQKMRAFITHMSGSAPQDMSVSQWEDQITWFEQFVERNKVKGLIKYINDCLGVK